MNITKEQIKRLADVAKNIEYECLIDDDVSGGYLNDPVRTWVGEIYSVIDEIEQEVKKEENCFQCHDRGILYDDNGIEIGTCTCHLK
jgi:hypothetical protein